MTALRRTLTVSFEFFPPKTAEMEERLWDTITKLAPLSPRFVSVTYGAGGSTRERTHRTVTRIAQETRLNPAGHLTCVCATRAEVDDVIRSYKAAGVSHIVALRGDPPDGIGERYTPHPGGYRNAADLTAGIRAIGDFEVSVGCYPEKHPESPSFDADLDLLKQKIDAGATRAITQFFFEPALFFRFRDRAARAGITIPIVPGVMLQPNFKGLSRMAGLCGATLPPWLRERFDGLEGDAETRELIAAQTAAELCMGLADGGVEHFHFYTLNRPGLAFATCRLLGVHSDDQAAA